MILRPRFKARLRLLVFNGKSASVKEAIPIRILASAGCASAVLSLVDPNLVFEECMPSYMIVYNIGHKMLCFAFRSSEIIGSPVDSSQVAVFSGTYLCLNPV
jgi:hypothetical protein